MINSTLKNANILIVDDNEENINVLEGLLEIQGLQILKLQRPRLIGSLFNSLTPI